MSTSPDRLAAWRLSDATNRAVRTAAQMGAILALITVVDAVTAWSTGGPFAWRIVVGSALTALLAPFAALLHRLVLDPSRVPSAAPPEPPAPPALVVHVTSVDPAGATATPSTPPPYFDLGNPDDDADLDDALAHPTGPPPPSSPAAVEALEHVDDVELDVPPPPAKARAAREEAAAEARQAKAKKPAKKAAKKAAARKRAAG